MTKKTIHALFASLVLTAFSPLVFNPVAFAHGNESKTVKSNGGQVISIREYQLELVVQAQPLAQHRRQLAAPLALLRPALHQHGFQFKLELRHSTPRLTTPAGCTPSPQTPTRHPTPQTGPVFSP